MAAILSSASDPSDLLNVSDSRIPYRFDQIFSAKGFGAKRLARNRLKLMKAIDPHVQTILSDGEKVQFVSWGTEYSFLEQFFMGLWSHLINRRALVFTDRRILMIQINSRRKVLDLKTQLRFQAIDKFATKTFGYIGLVLRNGNRFNITGIPRKDRNFIKGFVSKKISETRAEAPGLGIENLCPKCGNKVLSFPDRCRQCGQAFKSAKKAGWLSLVFPGLGDIYLGHRGLGIMEILGGMLAWGSVAVPYAWATFSEGGPWIVSAGVASGIFVFVHGTDCWITRRVGFKGIYPER
jgi:uncharacterized protein (DUF983 family)